MGNKKSNLSESDFVSVIVAFKAAGIAINEIS